MKYVFIVLGLITFAAINAVIYKAIDNSSKFMDDSFRWGVRDNEEDI